MYGITFGNEKVQKWVTSFVTSVFSSVFLTSPIQLTLNAVLMATIFRNKTDVFEDKVKDDTKIDNSAISHQENSVRYGLDAKSVEVADYVKRKLLIEKKIKDILKRCLVHAIFLTFLYTTAFSVRNTNSFNYQNYLSNRFLSDVQSVFNSNIIFTFIQVQIRFLIC
jgi:hypothetical protein